VKNVNGARLKERREMYNWSQQELAEKAGLSLHTVFRAEKGTNIQSKNLESLAKVLNTSVAYLMGEDDEPTNIKELSSYRDYDLVKLPVLSIESVVCAGDGVSLEYVDPEIEEWEYVSRFDLGIIDETRKPFIIRVEGDSMEGAGIYNGARVVVNPAVEVHDGNPAMVCYGPNLENAIKWVFWQTDGGVEIRSANSRYKSRFFNREERELGFFHVIGKVVMVITKPLNG
jgi:phage repressor protein C with HTH and peptisase S24 domain